MVHDYGFAPNPFWGFCTLGHCTPNHQGIKLSPGDWILGNSQKNSGNLLIYAMRIDETLVFDDYYRDPRFDLKKPAFHSTWKEQCGDNIYFRDSEGDWMQAETLFHTDESRQEQDLKYHKVFIGSEFFYFGGKPKQMPKRFKSLLRVGVGCSCNHSEALVKKFVEWLRATFKPGIHAKPRDLAEWAEDFEDT